MSCSVETYSIGDWPVQRIIQSGHRTFKFNLKFVTETLLSSLPASRCEDDEESNVCVGGQTVKAFKSVIPYSAHNSILIVARRKPSVNRKNPIGTPNLFTED